MKFEIHPRKSIGPIALGMEREHVRSTLGAMKCFLDFSQDQLDYFANNAIQVEYEEDDTVSFIGIACVPQIVLLYHGDDLFDMDAETAFHRIAAHESGDDHVFKEEEFIFPDQIISLWEADSQYDTKSNKGRSIWGQIGIGDERYLVAVQKINGTTEQTG